MTTKRHSFEGWADAATLTTAGSGSGTVLDAVTPGSGGTLTARTAAAVNGSRGGRSAVTTSAVANFVEYSINAGASTGSIWATVELVVPVGGYPQSVYPMRGMKVSNETAQCWRLALDTAGHVILGSQAFSGVSDAAHTLATSVSVYNGRSIRVEVVAEGKSTGAYTMSVFSPANSASASETFTGTGDFSAPIGYVRYGIAAASGTAITVDFDDVGVSDTGSLGPAILVPTVSHTWVGAVTDTTATVSYGTANITSAQLVVSTAADLSVSPITPTAVATDANGVVKLPVTGLVADTQYYVGVKGDGTLLGVGRGGFRTDPPAGKQASFSVAFGSCQQTGSNTATFTAIVGMTGPYGSPRRMIHEGDLHYRDFGSSNTLADIVAQYQSSLAASNLAALTSTLPMTYSWDNHDWGGVDSNSATPRAADLKTAYREYVPHYTLADAAQVSPTGAIYQSWVIGRVRFIDLDTRSERSDRTLTESSSKNMLSAQQEAWLYAELLQPEPVKVICSGIYWRQDSTNGDRWGSYSTQWARIHAWFQAHPAVQAYVIAGDRHALAADNGTSGGCYLPQAVGAALDQGGAASSEAWTDGYFTNADLNLKSFGWLDFTDNGATITIDFSGYTADGVKRVGMSTVFSVAGVTGQWGVAV